MDATTAFCDLPDQTRMALRDAIDKAGGNIEGYYGDAVQVAVPCPAQPFFEAMHQAGLTRIFASDHYFPLGSDVGFAPPHLRHDGSYPGSKGFWRYVNFIPR